jgi:hypothetical protein
VPGLAHTAAVCLVEVATHRHRKHGAVQQLFNRPPSPQHSASPHLDGCLRLLPMAEGHEAVAAGAARSVVPHDTRVAAARAGLEGGVQHGVRHVCTQGGGGAHACMWWVLRVVCGRVGGGE